MIAASDRASVKPVLHCRFDNPTTAARESGAYGDEGKAAGFRHWLAALLCSARVARKCVMSGRVNWSQIANRKRMRRQGVEDIKGATPVASQPPKQPRRKVSKAELREQAAAAFLAWRAGQTSKNK